MNFSELLVIGIVAFIVFGPERLPQLAKRAGQYWQQIQRMKSKWDEELDSQLLQLKLQENEEKAKLADQHYQPEPRE